MQAASLEEACRAFWLAHNNSVKAKAASSSVGLNKIGTLNAHQHQQTPLPAAATHVASYLASSLARQLKPSTYTAMMVALQRAGRHRDVMRVWEARLAVGLAIPDADTLRVLMGTMAHEGRRKEALDMFERLLEQGTPMKRPALLISDPADVADGLSYSACHLMTALIGKGKHGD